MAHMLDRGEAVLASVVNMIEDVSRASFDHPPNEPRFPRTFPWPRQTNLKPSKNGGFGFTIGWVPLGPTVHVY
jgi:hypothetical protein